MSHFTQQRRSSLSSAVRHVELRFFPPLPLPAALKHPNHTFYSTGTWLHLFCVNLHLHRVESCRPPGPGAHVALL